MQTFRKVGSGSECRRFEKSDPDTMKKKVQIHTILCSTSFTSSHQPREKAKTATQYTTVSKLSSYQALEENQN